MALIHESSGAVSDGMMIPGCGSCENTSQYRVHEYQGTVCEFRASSERHSKRGLGRQCVRNSSSSEKVPSSHSDFASAFSWHRHVVSCFRPERVYCRLSLQLEIGYGGAFTAQIERYSVFFVSLSMFIWAGHSRRSTYWKAVLATAFWIVECYRTPDDAMVC